MKTMSAAAAKGHFASNYTQLTPRPGTKLRVIYDTFMANKGVPVTFDRDMLYRHRDGKYISAALNQLTDIYGLDIRRVSRNYRSSSTYMLVGEWFGITYIDYLAERINKEE